jgi:hypothetical protein
MIRKMLVQLPFGEVEVSVCNICGEVRSWDLSHPESQLKHPDVKVGDITTISCEDGSKIVRRTFRVAGFRYAQENEFIYGCIHRPQLHELCVNLEEDLGHGTKSLLDMTYREFRLRRAGDTEGLQELGMLPKPKRPMFISRLFLGFPKGKR